MRLSQGRAQNLDPLPDLLARGSVIATAPTGVSMFISALDKQSAHWNFGWRGPQSTAAELNALLRDPATAQVLPGSSYMIGHLKLHHACTMPAPGLPEPDPLQVRFWCSAAVEAEQTAGPTLKRPTRMCRMHTRALCSPHGREQLDVKCAAGMSRPQISDLNARMYAQQAANVALEKGASFSEPWPTLWKHTSVEDLWASALMDKLPHKNDTTAPVIFIGDSCHAMTPFSGTQACQHASGTQAEGWMMPSDNAALSATSSRVVCAHVLLCRAAWCAKLLK